MVSLGQRRRDALLLGYHQTSGRPVSSRRVEENFQNVKKGPADTATCNEPQRNKQNPWLYTYGCTIFGSEQTYTYLCFYRVQRWKQPLVGPQPHRVVLQPGVSQPQYLTCRFPGIRLARPLVWAPYQFPSDWEIGGDWTSPSYYVSYKTILGFMYLTKLFGMWYILHNYLYMFCISQNYLSMFCIPYLEPSMFCKLSWCVLYQTQLS